MKFGRWLTRDQLSPLDLVLAGGVAWAMFALSWWQCLIVVAVVPLISMVMQWMFQDRRVP